MRESIKKHGFTRVDHVTFDLILPTLSPAAQLVFLRIYRQTVGWDKPLDAISLSAFCKMTAFADKDTILKALEELLGKKLIIAIGQARKVKTFGINWETVDSYAENRKNGE